MEGRGIGRIDYEAAPQPTLREGLQVKAGDDAEVVKAAFERFEQICM